MLQVSLPPNTFSDVKALNKVTANTCLCTALLPGDAEILEVGCWLQKSWCWCSYWEHPQAVNCWSRTLPCQGAHWLCARQQAAPAAGFWRGLSSWGFASANWEALWAGYQLLCGTVWQIWPNGFHGTSLLLVSSAWCGWVDYSEVPAITMNLKLLDA